MLRGLCDVDRKVILDMKLHEIGEEFRLTDSILLGAIELLLIAQSLGGFQEKDDRKSIEKALKAKNRTIE